MDKPPELWSDLTLVVFGVIAFAVGWWLAGVWRMDDLMTARLSRFLEWLLILAACLGWAVAGLCWAERARCRDCWMTDQQRELWKYDGRVMVEK